MLKSVGISIYGHMYGLAYIRTGCNISQSEQADILQEGEQSFDERYVEAQKRKKRTLEEISAMIDGKPCDFLDGMTMSIHNGFNMYDFMTRLLQRKDQQARGLKVPFRYELLNILLAMELAYDVEGDLEARRREYCADDSVVHCDEQFILQMAALMRDHWDQQREWRCDGVVEESPAGLFFYCLIILTFCEGRELKSSLLVGGNMLIPGV